MTARLPNADQLFATLDATWPAALCRRCGPWLIRDGQGGGKRVSAATAAADGAAGDIASAEAAMRALGQTPLFLLREGEQALDAALAARGYRIVDPVVIYAAPCTTVATPSPAPLTAFAHWPPLAIAVEIWAAAGIGPARLAVMDRVAGPKTAILGRIADRASGAAFLAIHDSCAMLHALEVAPTLRRQGGANNILRSAACWAQDHGAATLSLVVTQANAGARTLYASLGMEVVGQYHYRQNQAPPEARAVATRNSPPPATPPAVRCPAAGAGGTCARRPGRDAHFPRTGHDHGQPQRATDQFSAADRPLQRGGPADPADRRCL